MNKAMPTVNSGIADAVTEAYEAFIRKGYEFKVVKADSNHDAVRYTWEMTPRGGGEVASIGTHFAEFDAEGRIVQDHQSADLLPQLQPRPMTTTARPSQPVGDLLREWRRRRKLTQMDLSLEAGISDARTAKILHTTTW